MLEVVTSPEAPICPFHPHKWERLLFEASEFNKASKQTNKQETKKRTRNDGIGDTSRLQVSAERGRWSKTNTNLWTRTPSQMKDLWKHFPIYFNSWDLNIRIHQSNIARSYCKWPRRVTTIEGSSSLRTCPAARRTLARFLRPPTSPRPCPSSPPPLLCLPVTSEKRLNLGRRSFLRIAGSGAPGRSGGISERTDGGWWRACTRGDPQGWSFREKVSLFSYLA